MSEDELENENVIEKGEGYTKFKDNEKIDWLYLKFQVIQPYESFEHNKSSTNLSEVSTDWILKSLYYKKIN